MQMRKIKNIFPAFIVIIFIFVTCFTTSCDDYKSEEFKISDLDSKACQQLQRADSLGADTVTAMLLSDFDSTWVDSLIYNEVSQTYSNVSDIIDSLVTNDIIVTNTSTNKVRLVTLADFDTCYFALQTSSASLTFFFGKNVSINLINAAGEITGISNRSMPLETAAGCTKLDDNDVEVPFIQARLEISVPGNPSLLQVIKNEQTKARVIYVSIL
jgi:hypothetical protein